MSRSSFLPSRRGIAPDPRISSRSAFLASAWRRMAYAAVAAAALWALTGWALGWWPR